MFPKSETNDTEPKISLWSKNNEVSVKNRLSLSKDFIQTFLLNANLQPTETSNRFESFC